MTTGQYIYFNPELAEYLAKIGKAEDGPLAEKREVLLKMYDTAQSHHVAPPRYALSTQSRYQLQPVSYGYFVLAGTGVLSDIRAFTGGGAKKGLLNRLDIDVTTGKITLGNSGSYSPLPDEIFKWARKTFMKDQATAMAQHERSGKGGAIEFSAYPEYDTDWRAVAAHEIAMCETSEGVWGRYAEKIFKRALVRAFTRGDSRISQDDFDWAKCVVDGRLGRFIEHFEEQGGGAVDDDDAMCLAFMRVFKVESLGTKYKTKGFLQWSDVSNYAGTAWKRCKDPRVCCRFALTN